MTESHKHSCSTCKIHIDFCANIRNHYQNGKLVKPSGCPVYDAMDTIPDEQSDAIWNALDVCGCASWKEV